MCSLALRVVSLALFSSLGGGLVHSQDPGGQGQPPVPPKVVGGDDGSTGVESVEAAQAGVDESGVVHAPAAMLAHGRVSFSGFTDPKRLSPGESGTLFVQVEIREQTVVPMSPLRLDFLPEQGPLTLGDTRFDPPKSRDSLTRSYVPGYYDTFLVRVPITVRAGASHGKFPVRTKFVFSVAEAAGGRVSEQLSQDVAVDVVVGPPVPKPPAPPVVRRERGAVDAGSSEPTAVRGAGAEPQTVAATEPAKTVGGVGNTEAMPDPGGPGRGREVEALRLDPEPTGGGGWFVGAMAAGAALVLLAIGWLVLRGRG